MNSAHLQQDYLQSRHILLGITGGIAAYKTAELIRLLIKQGHTVQVVMTEAATHFITPTTLQALSGNPVFIDSWDSRIANAMPHIELSRQADALLVAPASADFIAKLAHGFANDLLSTLCLARECPLLVAPAMNRQMWENASTQRNIAQLLKDQVTVLGPDSGEQACGEVGQGRMLEPEILLEGLQTHFTPKLLAGKKILITAGATMEMLDPVRGITNISSGKMGYALAKVATQMGAEVTLVYGHATTARPQVSHASYAGTANEMYQSVMRQIVNQDVFIAVAAVADYSPLTPADQKIKKSEDTLTIQLKKNKDILADVASLPNPPYCVGFAAETEHVLEHATQKRLAKKIPMIVANQARQALGSDHNSVTIIDETGEYPLDIADKTTIAANILTHLKHQLK
ncbi:MULTISPECIES: bifunctional phosphopantothenoylcysteine decarboxylase/phosphopantothenate--cysteine ligase CoaBC [unclassified Methylophilus]|uniref:bifunctional phosphopantothenoylcysteine decarboxylase/phosphopantothenate--cysteine ligase CoaBC n=1 Tax=unclassified Methylophilus TaxID=2630143 RepID=UPI0006F3DBF4|nr:MULTISPECIES: bifunctional phosphopantothenoylcysteine decarboxylase/phosphopantothenate--cysteine ligase CoaBC [unclassified Methylophilus]KQT44049.1 phosphopantothenate synthase [Methylophilus sp. Leaf416]KQT59533.1 phosphopantothenate synthase [Methylophilus sp. Leaf459]